jgi:D-tyrosyl-tRNA(Tyr) deacylase
MRAVVQRVSRARVTVDGNVKGEITTGLLILLGVGHHDTSAVAAALAGKIANLRIFEDDQQKMNRSLLDVTGRALLPLRRLNKRRTFTKNLSKRCAILASPSRQEFSAQ